MVKCFSGKRPLLFKTESKILVYTLQVCLFIVLSYISIAQIQIFVNKKFNLKGVGIAMYIHMQVLLKQVPKKK